MLRRSHKKSRAGCLECKRRHVKCDEQRPKCIICTLSDRDCSYAPSSSPPASTSTTVGGGGGGHSPGSSTSFMMLQTSPMASLSPAPMYSASFGLPGSVSGHIGDAASVPGVPIPDLGQPSSLYQDVNLAHMELLIRFKFADHAPELNLEMHDFSSRLLFKCALEAPYLMHQMLAVSARHLTVLKPDRAEFFLEHAMHLQTRAVSIYNETAAKAQINTSNCSALLLFCSLLGRHFLADMLAKRDAGFDSFLDRYLQFLSISRGLKATSMSAWELLLESDIRHLVLWALNLSQAVPQGHHCNEIQRLVAESPILDLSGKAACARAIAYLQVGFDSILGGDIRNQRYLMIFMWPASVPEEFTELLEQRQPEAIAIMGYWALYLHCSKEVWHVGDSGAYLLRSIAQYLGPSWHHWLSWPLAMLANS
ncbi:hypothetical protein QBC38DRAFT_125060 [Podospora fimiseda]|uniref:Zn(2)-C6 fungal-type domain-containing protein n=1 Tax=Podospora fimiseda TaxID=252190 RepID=A0AAN7BTH8_9PEZI|nr:hypothetical protein QBC38DRAFT_125060 [Podospora fimiseda]